jgi:hypothetical protein
MRATVEKAVSRKSIKMARSRPFKDANPDLRRQVQMPAPPIETIESELRRLLQPSQFKPIGSYHQIPEKLRRDRLLTLPVMLAILLSLVSRKVPSLSELIRVLAQEGLLWVEPLRVSKQALSQRLMHLPARLFERLFEQVLVEIQHKRVPHSTLPGWETLRARFAAIWVADGSTLEELRCALKVLQGQGTVLAGRIMVVVEVLTHRPVASWYTTDATANDRPWLEDLLSRLPVGGLLLFDLGFFKFAWFDAFTENQKYFVTRQREKTAYQVQKLLSSGTHYRDEIILMGQYRSHRCHYPLRLVSVLWGNTWYRYLTNVLDPAQLSAQQVCDLYRRRWKVEEAFAVTKRLLGLAYLWVGDSNGVQIQIYATWILYAVLNDLCAQVAIALRQPLEKISLEMVFRGLYHFAKAVERGEAQEVISFFQTHHRLLGLVKADRQRHRQRDALSQQIWGASPSLS